MTEGYFDQIEFRWRNGYDLSAFTSSDPAIQDRWDKMLRDFVGVPAGRPDLSLPSSSAVYLVTEKGEAALVLRSDQPGAVRVAMNVEAGRHRLVARVLIGPARLLTPERALYLALAPGSELMGAPPGQADALNGLPRVPADGLLRYADAQGADLALKARAERRLAGLVEARLSAPADPLRVILPRDEAGRSLSSTPALPLLLGLIKITEPLLDGIASPLGGNAGFSTFEPEVEGDGRVLPHVVFQPLHHRAGAAPSRSVRVPLLGGPPGDGLGAMLAKAYEELGSGLEPYLRQAASGADDLAGRLEILRTEPDLRNYWGGRDRHPSAPGRSAQPTRPATPRPPQRPDDPHGRQGPPQAPRQRATGHAPPAAATTGRADEDAHGFVEMYRRLAQLREGPGFRELLALMIAKSADGHPLPPAHAPDVLNQIIRQGWYCERLTREYAGEAAEQLSLLLRPVLLALLRERHMFTDARQWGNVPPLVREAMAKARLRMTDEQGGAVLEDFLLRLFRMPYRIADPQAPAQAEQAPVEDDVPDRVYGLPAVRSVKVAAVFVWMALVSTAVIGLQIVWAVL